MMWLGGSPASWTMYSPRSVSITSKPAASRWGLRPISSPIIDFALATTVPPARRQRSAISAFASSPSAAQWTVVPAAVAAASHASR